MKEHDAHIQYRGLKMNLSTIRAYAEAINLGTKYIYQTVPRLLTLWLDLGEDAKVAETDTFRLINQAVSGAIKNSPTYKVKEFLSSLIECILCSLVA